MAMEDGTTIAVHRKVKDRFMRMGHSGLTAEAVLVCLMDVRDLVNAGYLKVPVNCPGCQRKALDTDFDQYLQHVREEHPKIVHLDPVAATEVSEKKANAKKKRVRRPGQK